MATSLFQLVGSIMVDNSAANESLAKTDSTASKVASTLGSGVKAAGKFAAGVTTAAAGAVTAITSMATSSAAAMDEIDKASQKMGISAEAYQEWDHIMQQNGMSIDTMKSGMRTFTKAMQGLSEEGDEANSVLADMGISLANADGSLKSTEEVMQEAITALAEMDEGAERSALAVKLFGKAGTEMAPMLNSGAESIEALRSEAHELGLVFGEEAVKSGANLNDTMANVKNSIGAVKTSLGNALVPVVQKFADKLLDFVPRLQAMFDKIAPVLEKLFDDIMPPLFDLVESLLPVFESALDAILPILADLGATVIPIIVELVQKIVPILSEIFERLMPIVQKVFDALMPVLDALWPIVSIILDLILDLLDPLFTVLDVLLKPLLTLLDPLVNVLNLLTPILSLISTVLQPILDLINLILKPINDFISWIFGGISDGINGVVDSLGGEGGGLLGILGGVADFILGGFSAAFDVLGSLFGGIIDFIKNPKEAIENFFSWVNGTVGKIKESLVSLASSVGDLIDAKKDEKASEGLKGYTAELEQKVKSGTIDVNDKAAVNALRSQYGLPALASGAVLEPNHPFLAVVGDQKSGTNVEAPLSTIQEAVRNELQNVNFNVSFEVSGDSDAIFNIVKKKSWSEKRRTGQSQMA